MNISFHERLIASQPPSLLSMSGDKEKKKTSNLDWRDYVALFIASLETVFLPLVILIGILIAVFVVIR